jgi:two-component system nitrogen regulation sensor histidine kinase NtrY
MTMTGRASGPASYVMGTAMPGAGRSACHSSRPVSTSNARKRLSMVAAMNIKPPAVMMGPPMLGEPQAFGVLNSPKGPTETRGVQEFTLLREALRKMASELEEGRRQAIQAAKLRSWTEMARRVAHELKNPLTPMKMAASRIGLMEDEGAQEAGAVLLEEIARLDEMARTFSQFGRMPEGPPSEVDIAELMVGLTGQHEGGGPELRCQAPSELPLVLGHYEALLRCFRNLLLNAMDAAGEGGLVQARIWHQDSRISVEIRDSGPGIPPQHLEQIWEADFTTKNRGTGLGLPLVRQTIQIHHGRVAVRNHPEGGAVFLVELPLEGPKTVSGPKAS